MTTWKYAATRCAVPECESQRRKGWSTCGRVGHYERGVSLYGLKPKDPRLVERECANPLDTPVGSR